MSKKNQRVSYTAQVSTDDLTDLLDMTGTMVDVRELDAYIESLGDTPHFVLSQPGLPFAFVALLGDENATSQES